MKKNTFFLLAIGMLFALGGCRENEREDVETCYDDSLYGLTVHRSETNMNHSFELIFLTKERKYVALHYFYDNGYVKDYFIVDNPMLSVLSKTMVETSIEDYDVYNEYSFGGQNMTPEDIFMYRLRNGLTRN